MARTTMMAPIRMPLPDERFDTTVEWPGAVLVVPSGSAAGSMGRRVGDSGSLFGGSAMVRISLVCCGEVTRRKRFGFTTLLQALLMD